MSEKTRNHDDGLTAASTEAPQGRIPAQRGEATDRAIAAIEEAPYTRKARGRRLWAPAIRDALHEGVPLDVDAIQAAQERATEVPQHEEPARATSEDETRVVSTFPDENGWTPWHTMPAPRDRDYRERQHPDN
jgi:hypothetical protein